MGIIADTPEGIALFRLITLKHGLASEIRGLRVSRGRTCYSILKGDYGYTGSRQKVLDDVTATLDRYEGKPFKSF